MKQTVNYIAVVCMLKSLTPVIRTTVMTMVFRLSVKMTCTLWCSSRSI